MKEQLARQKINVDKSFCKLDFIVTAIILIIHLSSTDTCKRIKNEGAFTGSEESSPVYTQLVDISPTLPRYFNNSHSVWCKGINT